MCRTNSFEIDFFNRSVYAWSLVKSKAVTSFKYNLESIDFIVILKLCLLEFEFILFLLCSLICNYGVTIAVIFLYPVTTKDTC